MILWLSLLASLVGVAVFRFRRRRMYQLAEAIPATKLALPLVGIAYSMIGDNEHIMKQLQDMSTESRKHDGLVKCWLGHILYFIQTNPADVEVVLKSCLEKDDLHRFVRALIGNGGIFAPVSIWRRRRKILVPAFSPKLLENFVEVFSEQSEKLVKNLADYAGKGPIKAWPMLFATTIDAIFETAMGVKINAQDNPSSQFLSTITDILSIMTKRIFHLWLHPDWLFKLFPCHKLFETSKKTIYDFTDEVINKKREEVKKREESNTEINQQYGLEALRNASFLDFLITLSGGEKGYTNLELREEVVTLTIAGSDTSAVNIGNTLKLLGKYPHIQDKVYQELCEVFGNSDRPLVKEDLKNLIYLERVIKESLRLYPPVPFVIRKVLEDITLPSGRTLPAGSGVVVSIWGIHRDPKYWGPDADHFDPDRFLPDRLKLAHPCSYMPFSHGPRNCVGFQYAMMTAKTQLSTVLRRYKVLDHVEEGPAPTMQMKLDIMMKETNGYEMAFERRRQP